MYKMVALGVLVLATEVCRLVEGLLCFAGQLSGRSREWTAGNVTI